MARGLNYDTRGIGGGDVISRTLTTRRRCREHWHGGWWAVVRGFGGGTVNSRDFPRVEGVGSIGMGAGGRFVWILLVEA